jgi:hypothetical protein
MEVRAPPAFTIHYATGWKGAVLHVRSVAAPGEPQREWQAIPMHSTASRARPQGGNWLTATIPAEVMPGAAVPVPPANGAVGGPAVAARAATGGGAPVQAAYPDAYQMAGAGVFRQLEFFVSSSDGSKEDRPRGGAAYRCFHPGGYKLRSGQLCPFPMSTQPPMMLVSSSSSSSSSLARVCAQAELCS